MPWRANRVLKRLAACWSVDDGCEQSSATKVQPAQPCSQRVSRAGVTSSDAVAVVLTLLDNASFQWSAIGGSACQVVPGQNSHQEGPRVVCCLTALHGQAKAASGLLLPPHSHESGWLSLQPVSADAAALAAWSAVDLPALQQRLLRLADSDPCFLQTLSEVAASVAAPQGAAWLQAPCSSLYTSAAAGLQHMLPGGCVRVSSSYIRDQQNGTLRPALLLEAGPGKPSVPVTQAQQTAPAPASDSPHGAPLHLLDSPQCSRPASSRTVSTGLLASRSGLAVSPAMEAAQAAPSPSNRHGLSSCMAETPNHFKVQRKRSLLAASPPSTGLPPPPVYGQADWKPHKQMVKQQRRMLRGQALMDSMPCIATLVELADPSLHVSAEDWGSGHPSGTPLTGRVLWQNEQSLLYWGKLSRRSATGSLDMFSVLLQSEPDAMQELWEHLVQHRQQQEQEGQWEEAVWDKTLQVPWSGRAVSRALRQELSQQRKHDAADSNSLQLLVLTEQMDVVPPVLPLQHGLPAMHAASASGVPDTAGTRSSVQMHTPFRARTMTTPGCMSQLLYLAAARSPSLSRSPPPATPAAASAASPFEVEQVPSSQASTNKPLDGMSAAALLSERKLQSLTSIEEGRTLQRGTAGNSQEQAEGDMPSAPLAVGIAMSSNGNSEQHSTMLYTYMPMASGPQDGPGLPSRGWSQPGGTPQPGSQRLRREVQLGQLPQPQEDAQDAAARGSEMGTPLGRAIQLPTQPLSTLPSDQRSPLASPVGSVTKCRRIRKLPTESTLAHSPRQHSACSEDGSAPQRLSAGHSPLMPLQVMQGNSSAGGLKSPGLARSMFHSSRNLDNTSFALQVQQSHSSALLASPGATRTFSGYPDLSGPPSVSMRALKLSMLIDPYMQATGSCSSPASGHLLPVANAPSSPTLHSGAAAGGTPNASPLSTSQAYLERCSERLRKTPSLPAHTFGIAVSERATVNGVVRRVATGPLHPGPGSWSRAPSTLGPSAHTRSQRRLQLDTIATASPGQLQLASYPDVALSQPHSRDVREAGDEAGSMRPGASEGQLHPQGLWDLAALCSSTVLSEWPRAAVDEPSDSSGSGRSSLDDQHQDNAGGDMQAGDEDQAARWHEVQVMPVTDPVTGKQALLVLQRDITERHVMTTRMATLTETQLRVLENMFPRQVLEYAVGAGATANQSTLGSLAFQHEEVTVLFLDIVGFTSMSKAVQPAEVMAYLNCLMSQLDELCEDLNVYKVDTAGDCYIVAGALMTVDSDGFMAFDWEADARLGARSVVDFARAALQTARAVPMPNGQPTTIRVGIHTGSVVSGLLGTKLLKFSLFGDTMNTSSRMESTCKPGCIQMSEVTYGFLHDDQRSLFQPTGGVEVKGKGLMATYIWQPDGDEEWVGMAEDLTIIPEATEAEEMLTSQDDSGVCPGWGAGVMQLQPSRPRMHMLHTRSTGSASSASQLPDPTALPSAACRGKSESCDSHSRDSQLQQPHSSPLQLLAPGSAGMPHETRPRRVSLSALPNPSTVGLSMRWRLQTTPGSTAPGAVRLGRARRVTTNPRQGLADVFRAAAAVIEQQEQQLSSSPSRTTNGWAAALRQLPSLSRRGE